MLLDIEPPETPKPYNSEEDDRERECWAESKLGHVCMRIYKEGMCETFGQFFSLEECVDFLLEKMRKKAAGEEDEDEYENEEEESA